MKHPLPLPLPLQFQVPLARYDQRRRLVVRFKRNPRRGPAGPFQGRWPGTRRALLRRFLTSTEAALPALAMICFAVAAATHAHAQVPVSTSRVVTAGRVVPARTIGTDPSVRPAPLAPSSDPCKAALDELAALRLEAAGKVKEIERVRLLDPGLGAVMQTALSDLNARIKIAELAVARCDERERERRDDDKLRAIQAHELRMVEQQHRNQKDLLQYQQGLARPAPGPEPAEKDFFDLWADSLESSARLNQGVRQLKSTDAQVQADGLRNIGGAVRQMAPRK